MAGCDIDKFASNVSTKAQTSGVDHSANAIRRLIDEVLKYVERAVYLPKPVDIKQKKE